MVEGLNSNVEAKQDRIELYHHLRILLQETDEAAFQVLLQQFLSRLLERFPQYTLMRHMCLVVQSGHFVFQKVQL